MPPRTNEEKERRKLLRQQKRDAREKKRAQEEVNEPKEPPKTENATEQKPAAVTTADASTPSASNQSNGSLLLHIPVDAMRLIMCHLAAHDLGSFTLVCTLVNHMLFEVRVSYLLSRLNRPNHAIPGAVGFTEMLTDQAHARQLIQDSFGGGDTGRLVTKKCRRNKSGGNADEFVAFARFLEESVCGYAPMVSQYGSDE